MKEIWKSVPDFEGLPVTLQKSRRVGALPTAPAIYRGVAKRKCLRHRGRRER